MGVTLKIRNLWRVISEIDLESIRQNAHAPFDIWLIDEGQGVADRLRIRVSADPRVPHPSLRVVRAADVADHLSVLPSAAIVITGDGVASRAIESTLTALRGHAVPIVVAVPQHRMDANPQALTPDRVLSATERRVSIPAPAPVDVDHDWPDEASLLRIGAALVAVVPADLRLALARQFPPLRPAVFDLTIDETAKANASYALTTGFAEVVPLLTAPLNLGDMIVLTKNQLVMSYRLLLATGRDGEPRALIGEILGVLGGGLLFRQLARQLVGLIPVVGILPKVAIAYGGTWAIGRAVVLWATEGREVTNDLVRTLSTEGLQRGRAVATRLIEQTRSQKGRATKRFERLREQLPFVGRSRRP